MPSPAPTQGTSLSIFFSRINNIAVVSTALDNMASSGFKVKANW